MQYSWFPGGYGDGGGGGGTNTWILLEIRLELVIRCNQHDFVGLAGALVDRGCFPVGAGVGHVLCGLLGVLLIGRGEVVDGVLYHVSWVYGFFQAAGDALHWGDVFWHFVFLLLVHGAGEGVPESNGSEEHFNADDEVLPACRHGAGADLLSVDEKRIGNDAAAFQDGQDHPLPEGQEDDGFNCEEFEHRFVRPEQVTCCEEEEEKSVEGQTDREVVDDCDVQVSSIHIEISVMIFAKGLQDDGDGCHDGFDDAELESRLFAESQKADGVAHSDEAACTIETA